MRRYHVNSKVMVILLLMLCSIGSNVTAEVIPLDIDISSGQISTQDSWYLDNRITFTQENATLHIMVEDNRITFEHSRPTNLQTYKMGTSLSNRLAVCHSCSRLATHIQGPSY